jgi:diguanylate cyclase (GGDEF)-like protein
MDLSARCAIKPWRAPADSESVSESSAGPATAPITLGGGEDHELDERHVRAARARAGDGPSARERLSASALGLGFLAACAALLAMSHAGSPAPVTAAVGLATYVFAYRVQFEVGPGSAVPTQLVLVPLLLEIPLAYVPIVVAVAISLSTIADRGLRSFWFPLVVNGVSAWHVIGPVVVLTALAPATPSLSAWPVYTLALASQFAVDLIVTLAHNGLGRLIAPRTLFAALRWTFSLDALLAPVGLALVLAAPRSPALPFLLACAPIGMLWLLSDDRRRYIDRALELNDAYRTAHEHARVDPLTTLGNRLAWDEALAAARTYSRIGFACVMLDVDGLKLANDSRGHAFGDRMLWELGQVVRANVPEGAIVARIGGDEFGVILPAADAGRHEEIAGWIADRLGRHAGIDGIRLSASVGSAATPPCANVDEAIALADERIYEQKRQAGGSRAVA